MNPISGLYAIADQDWNPRGTLTDFVRKILSGGCKIVQLRMKNSKPDDVYNVASEVIKLKGNFDFTFIINDYVDVALKIGADGIHVGKNDASVKKLKERVGGRFIIGYSSHSFEEAVQAEKDGADYVAVGAIYKTATKGEGHPIVGIETLRKITSSLKVPVVAIGGIKRENVCDVFEAGANAAAMITALTKASDITEETRWFVNKIRTGYGVRSTA